MTEFLSGKDVLGCPGEAAWLKRGPGVGGGGGKKATGMTRTLPATFGRYQVLRKLGEGGMGTIYLARDTQLDRLVALKVPRLGDDDQPSPESLRRFFREARAAASLRHPNVCPIYDVGEVGGTPFLTMAYVDGCSLSRLIEPTRPLTQGQAARIVGKLAEAMQEAHERGVVHRDLKPSNVMIDPRGEPVIMDFGLARVSGAAESRLTHPGTLLGTPAYMPPEQIQSESSAAGPLCDVYALGVILYELVAGRLPFQGSVLAILGRILTEAPPPPSKHRPDLDPGLEAVCLKAMARDADDRYASMAELAQALRRHYDAIRDIAPAISAADPATGGRGESPETLPLPASVTSPFSTTPTGGGKSESRLKKARPAEPVVDSDFYTAPMSRIELRRIRAGSFLMGSPDDDADALADEKPRHEVRITRPFYIGVYQVTQAQYRAAMGSNPSWFCGTGGGRDKVVGLPTDQNPVDGVFWLDAVRFCNKLSEQENLRPFYEIRGQDVSVPRWDGTGYRLPTEAEWEYACRAGSMTSYCFGDGVRELAGYAWFGGEGGSTHPVGLKRTNAWGLCDMHGNVWEWCWDWFSKDYYQRSPAEDPRGPEPSRRAPARVIRGGSWDDDPKGERSAYRNRYTSLIRPYSLGFRVVRTQANG
jgi:serine/threonine protein kinase/formylglycine-generating enzyme required for sulfatase activity